MRNKFAPWLLALGTGSLLLTACGTTPAPQPKATTKSSKSSAKPNTATNIGTAANRLKVIAFYDQSMSSVAPDPFVLVKAHPGLVNYLSPFWYEVSSAGAIISKPEGNAATLAAQDHLPLMPLFNNAGGSDAFLASPTTRSTAVSNIVKLVTTNKYAGVNIDFQLLKATDRTYLTQFMQSLRQAMPTGDIISMSVVPLTSNSGQSSAYDFAALNKVVDAMVLMAYDLHGDGTPPGPVSPYMWVRKSITTALNAGIQPSKLYLGIANYGYLWSNGSTKATTIPLKVMHQHQYGTYLWSPTHKEAYDRYTSNGQSHMIWFVNDRAAVDRINLAKRYHLAGVAFWRIGYEDAKWWNAVATAISSSAKSPASANAARPRLSPHRARKALNAPANTLRKAGNKAQRNIKGPAKKSLIAPAHKAKNGRKTS